MKIQPETVYAKHTDLIKATKDTGTFGGPNMWRIYVKCADGNWDSIQWVDVYHAESILGVTLTKYTAHQTVRKVG